MANVIKLKRGSGSDPQASDLVVGELCIRTDNGKLFTKKDSGAVSEISAGGNTFVINTLSQSNGTGGGSATFNGTAYRFTMSNPPSTTSAQCLVSINGVVQKPIANQNSQPAEGFTCYGNDIIFSSAPASGADFFIVTYISLAIGVPSDSTVSLAKLTASGTASSSTYLRGDNSWASIPAGVGGATGADFNDDVKLRFGHDDGGSGGDVDSIQGQLWWDETNNYFNLGLATGSSHKIDISAQTVEIRGVNRSSNMAIFRATAGQDLFYGTTKRFETTNTGATTTGTHVATAFSGSGANLTDVNATTVDNRDTSSSGGVNKVVITDGSGNTSLGSGTITANGSGLSSLNASNLSSGTVAAARLDTATTQSAGNNSTKIATTAYADTAVSNLVDSAPGALNTLNELAAALGDDANFSTTVTNSIATKAVLSGSTNNTICTVTGANALQGEANLTFDGTQLSVTGSGTDVLKITSTDAGSQGANLIMHHASASPADNDVISLIQFNGLDDSSNSTTYSSIRAVATDVSNNSETGHLSFFTRGLGSWNEIFRLNARSTASAPSYTADDHNGIILDVYNTGNPYPRYMNFIAKSSGDTDSNIAFWTEAVGGSPTEKLRITSGGDILVGTTTLVSSTLVDGSTAITPTLQLDGTGSSTNTSGVINLSRKTGTGGSLIYSSGDDGGLCLRNTDGNGITLLNGTTKAVRIDSSGRFNFGDNLTQGSYPFSVQWDLGSSGSLAYFANSDSTYSQGIGLAFDSNKDIKWSGGSGSGGLIWNLGTRGYVWQVGGSEKLRLNSDGDLLPGADNTQDLGSTSKRWANVYCGDMNLSNKDSKNCVDSTWGEWVIQEGEEDLYLINKRKNKAYKFQLELVKDLNGSSNVKDILDGPPSKDQLPVGDPN